MSSVDTSIGQGGTFAQGPASPVQPPGMGITTVPTFLSPPANLSAAFTSGTVVALGSFPPAGPIDGQQAILELPSTYDPIGGKKIRWAFAYNASDAVWDFIGGAPLAAQVDTAEATVSTVYGNLATVGPAISLPRPGDYQITASFLGMGGTTLQSSYMAYSGGGITASDVDAAATLTPNVTGLFSTGMQGRTQTGLTASTITAKYRAGSASTQTFQSRRLSALPVRIT